LGFWVSLGLEVDWSFPLEVDLELELELLEAELELDEPPLPLLPPFLLDTVLIRKTRQDELTLLSGIIGSGTPGVA
jgi:hypothetical protein